METIEVKIEERMSKEIQELNFFKNINYNNPNKNEYIATKRELRFFQILFENKMNEEDENYKKIQDYIEKIEVQYPETQRFEEIFDEYDVINDRELNLCDYILRICSKYQGSQTQVFATTYINGITFDFKQKERYLKEIIPYLANEKILLIHDATFFANYSKGFVITDKMIVDLKTKQKIDFADIVDCTIKGNLVDAMTKNNQYLSFYVSNTVIKCYLESILKCYSSYKGRLLREEIEKLNKEIEKENDINVRAKNSAEECFKNGMKALKEKDIEEAGLNFIALEKISDNEEDRFISKIGLGFCDFNNRDIFIENVKNAVKYNINKNDEAFRKKVKQLLEYENVNGTLLIEIIRNSELELLKYFIEFKSEIDINKTYNNATLLDFAVFNRKLNKDKAEIYKEIEEILQNMGCERKWNIEYNKPYIKDNNIQDIIKQSIFKCVEKSNNEIKIGEDLRRSIPDKCQKAVVNLGVKYENPIYLIYDNTLFKTLKSGFVVCSDGIYIASEIGEHLFIPWRDILKSQIVVNGGYVFFEGAKIIVNQINAMIIYKLFDDLKYEISENKLV